MLIFIMHNLSCCFSKKFCKKSSKRNAISLICLCFHMYDESLKTLVLEKILFVLILYERSQFKIVLIKEGEGSEEGSGGKGEEKR